MAWIYVLVGGMLEIVWALGLKASDGFTKWVPSLVTVVALGISFFFFAKAMTRLEIGTAYAVYTGIGTAGTAIVGMAALGEPAGAAKLLFVALLIGGIIGLKVISAEKPPEETQKAAPAAGEQVGGVTAAGAAGTTASSTGEGDASHSVVQEPAPAAEAGGDRTAAEKPVGADPTETAAASKRNN